MQLSQPPPQQAHQPAAQQQQQPDASEKFGEQFAAYAYPEGTVFEARWTPGEQAYAKQVAAEFLARFAGLGHHAVYMNTSPLQVPGFTQQQVQETQSAKEQLFNTFKRCFAARFQADTAEASRKKMWDKIRQLLGHRR